MDPSPAPDADLAALRAEAAHLRRVNQELLATVAELRATIEKQQIHIDRLVRMTFGRRSERVTGPTLFDAVPDADPNIPAADPPVVPTPPSESAPAKQRGHGRRPRPTDLPRERVEIDLTDAEKVCPCCQTTRSRPPVVAPSSGRPASRGRVATGPTPGMLWSSASWARHAGLAFTAPARAASARAMALASHATC